MSCDSAYWFSNRFICFYWFSKWSSNQNAGSVANQRNSINLKTNLHVKYFQMDPCKDIPKGACALKVGLRIGSEVKSSKAFTVKVLTESIDFNHVIEFDNSWKISRFKFWNGMIQWSLNILCDSLSYQSTQINTSTKQLKILFWNCNHICLLSFNSHVAKVTWICRCWRRVSYLLPFGNGCRFISFWKLTSNKQAAALVL